MFIAQVQDEIRRRKEGQNRTRLREMLRDQLREGVIHGKMAYNEWLEGVGGVMGEAVRRVEGNEGGSRPWEMFMDVVEEAEGKGEGEGPLVA